MLILGSAATLPFRIIRRGFRRPSGPLRSGTGFVGGIGMRLRLVILLLAAGVEGCTAKPAVVPPPVVVPGGEQYEPLTAAALVFDPPVVAGEEPLELTREERRPSAFVGFDGPITTYYWIHTDDLQDSSWGSGGGANGIGSSIGDRFQRRAFIDTAGVRYR
jgi:hypothetical protein